MGLHHTSSLVIVCYHLSSHVFGNHSLRFANWCRSGSTCLYPGVSATYFALVGGHIRPSARNITSAHLDILFKFKLVNASSTSWCVSPQLRSGDIVVRSNLKDILSLYNHWHGTELRNLSRCHHIGGAVRRTQAELLVAMGEHVCDAQCSSFEYVFSLLATPRKSFQQNSRTVVHQADPPHVDVAASSMTLTGDAPRPMDHLQVGDPQLRDMIIAEWEDVMSPLAMSECVCAVCARCTPLSKITTMHPAEVDFQVLRNDFLPEYVLPVSYNRAAYDGAILHPKGLSDVHMRGDIRVCAECRLELKKGEMPKYALANWLYYGHERLPEDVRRAFRESTQVERMLYSRARSSKVSFRFCDIPGHSLEGTDPMTSQRCVKGNIAVHPQDATHLNDVLPPCNEIIRDSICAVFIGKTKPDVRTIQGLRPALVRKSRVLTVINFLTSRNPKYLPCSTGTFQGLSQGNLDALFGPGTDAVDEGIPCAMEIGHIEVNGAVEGATDSYVPGSVDPPTSSDVGDLMENVGYVDADNAPQNHIEMSMRALSHCLSGGSFLQSQAGSSLIPDFHNSSLLSWLFPHLDPWGIGAFHEPRRLRPLSLDQQLRYLLAVDGSPFKNDPDFAFVYYNISQKKAVYDSVSFRVSASQRESVVSDLLQVDVSRLERLSERFKLNPAYKPVDDDEKAILRLLQRVSTVSHDVPGLNGYKLAMRNQIRGLIYYAGSPTLFITINPSDRDHPLVRLFAGHDIIVENHMRGEELSRWQRSVLAAKNPSACAKFFDKMITNFIKIVLRHGRSGRGLFGKCTAYYGTVETQGRGTLHCHMLIWLDGHLPPQKLRDQLASDEVFRASMFKWLESVIRCELPGTESVVVEEPGKPLRRPVRSDPSGTDHPGAVAAPSLKTFRRRDEFQEAFETHVTNLVEEFNWHEHSSTCFKYVDSGTVPDDAAQRDSLCRMRIDGSTQPEYRLDPESGGIVMKRLHPRIASYNPVVTFLLKCNTDVKFVGSGEAAKALIYYVTDYITKASLPAHIGLGALSYAIQKTNDENTALSAETLPKSALTSTVNRMISRLEMSHAQVMSYLVGGGDAYRSHTFNVLHWGSFDRLFRKCEQGSMQAHPVSQYVDMSIAQADAVVLDVPMDTLDLDADEEQPDVSDTMMQGQTEQNEGGVLEDDVVEQDIEESFVLQLVPGSVSASNQQQDYIYRGTDPEFERLSLYEFVGTVEKMSLKYVRQHANNGEDSVDGDTEHIPRRRGRKPNPREMFSSHHHTQYDTHGLRKRSVWTVPVILGDRIPRSDRSVEEKEAWARMMLILFVPWREPSDLRSVGESWRDAFDRQKPSIPPMQMKVIENMNVFSECRDVRDSDREVRHNKALTFMRDGLSDERMEHSGSADDILTGDYDLYDKSDLHNIYDSIDNGERLQNSLDQLVGPRARQILDMCFDSGSTMCGNHANTEDAMSIVGDSDIPVIQMHQATMRHLKGQKRPLHGESQGRHAKRRRTGNVIQESVREATLLQGAGGSFATTLEERVVNATAQVVREMGLHDNAEQERAFRIVAEHVRRPGASEQLMMYIAGVGGTGKTHVVKAILRLFELLGRSHEIMVGAPTGSAALNIGGYTVHSLTMMPGKITKTLLKKLRIIWGEVKYFIIDEVSMIGAMLLAQISRRLQLAKGNDGSPATRPFGGINIIFTGDFGQLKPVQAASLYDYSYVRHPGLRAVRDCTGVDCLTGIYLWRHYFRCVVQLIKNQRQSSDPRYAALLGRARVGQSSTQCDRTTNDDSDVDVLYKRITHHVADEHPESLVNFRDAPIIVGTKDIRDTVNARIIAHKAKEFGITPTVVYSEDRVDKKPVSGSLRQGLWKLSSTTTKDSLGCLPLFPGMRVMVSENIAFSRRIVNGSEGVVKKVKHEVKDGITYAKVVYVHIPGSGKFSDALEPDVVPIFPVTSHFQCIVSVGGQSKKTSVSRTHLPLLPAYAYTDYKSQGKSLSYAIVDLHSARSLQGAYVMLSRVRALDGLMILRPFSPSKLCGNLSQELRDEFSRLQSLTDDTRGIYAVHHTVATVA